MIHTESPTRIDLAGGTLDCWPLFLFSGGASTINLAIDVFTNVKLKVREDTEVHISIKDLGWEQSFKNLDDLLRDETPENLLVREVLRAVKPKNGFHLETSSQSPVGGGLGGSSSLVVGLLRSLDQMENQARNAYQYVELAHNIEARVLHKPTGTQDYVPALLGGLNLIRYEAKGMSIENIDFDSEIFNRKIGLVYTGRPHHSGINNWDVVKKAVEGDSSTLNHLQRIADISEKVADICRSGDWGQLPGWLNEESEVRVQLSPGFTSPEIDELRKSAKECGAEAVKICGAGGGGCVLIWGDSEVHDKISVLCQKSELKYLPVKTVKALGNVAD